MKGRYYCRHLAERACGPTHAAKLVALARRAPCARVGPARQGASTTGTRGSIFIQADWSQLETWLTAHFSGDATLQRELDANLHGGPKVHALNAALIYGIDPADAQTHMVNFQGQRRPAYDCGKRLGHGFNYGMRARKMAEMYWLPEAFCEKAIARLSTKYAGVVSWRERLQSEVFGLATYRCGACGNVREGAGGTCPQHGSVRVNMTFSGWSIPPTRELRTPFGRRRLYLGRPSECANAVASQLPQSSGISMWYRTLQRLRGFEVVRGERRPVRGLPTGAYAATGTYDSFLVECDYAQRAPVAYRLVELMEARWPQLDNKRFPCDVAWGDNWGKHGERNEEGLRNVEREPFSVGFQVG